MLELAVGERVCGRPSLLTSEAACLACISLGWILVRYDN